MFLMYLDYLFILNKTYFEKEKKKSIASRKNNNIEIKVNKQLLSIDKELHWS